MEDINQKNALFLDNILNKFKVNIEKKARKVLPEDLKKMYNSAFHKFGQALVEANSCQKINPKFVIDEVNSELYKTLMRYFTNQPFEEKILFPLVSKSGQPVKDNNKIIKSKWEIDKGLLIIGSSGRGKDLTLKIFNTINFYFEETQAMQHKKINCSDVVMGYSEHGDKHFNNYREGICYFADLGDENKSSSNYANKLEVMREMIMIRYELWIKNKTITHFTTNLDAFQLYERYGERAFFRLFEMCNFCVMQGENKRIQK